MDKLQMVHGKQGITRTQTVLSDTICKLVSCRFDSSVFEDRKFSLYRIWATWKCEMWYLFHVYFHLFISVW